jgi:uncharacterized protein YdeI (YjbR/CyaY-like superfamily)
MAGGGSEVSKVSRLRKGREAEERRVAAAGAEMPVLAFRSGKDWRKWLQRNHAGLPGVWLQLSKKGSGVESLTYPEALDEALCYGWIDGQARRYDDRSYLQRFTPRRRRSMWSKINRERVARLIRDKRMQPAGLKEVARAKEDGRWEAAYDAPSRSTVPADFTAVLARNNKAQAFFRTLNRQNIYAICFRLHAAKNPETRARRIAQFVAMCAAGKAIHPVGETKNPRRGPRTASSSKP